MRTIRKENYYRSGKELREKMEKCNLTPTDLCKRTGLAVESVETYLNSEGYLGLDAQIFISKKLNAFLDDMLAENNKTE